MECKREERDGALLLRVTQRALVRAPDWRTVGVPCGDGSRLVALDLGSVDFVSSLFWQACVELSREMAARGGRLVLMNLDEQQKQLLHLVEGSEKLHVTDDEKHLPAKLNGQAKSEGVTGEEKQFLWR